MKSKKANYSRVRSKYFFLFILACFSLFARETFAEKEETNKHASEHRPTRFPLKISENGRYFVDKDGQPYLYTADTAWKLFYKLTIEEAREFFGIRKTQGFNTIQISLLPFNPVDGLTINGISPMKDVSQLVLDEQYVEHVNQVIQLAREMDMLLVVGTMWKDCCGNGWNQRLERGNNTEFREYGRQLGRLFGHHKNLLWFHGGDNDAKQHTDLFRQIALGIKEKASGQLQTYHAASTHSSTDAMPVTSNAWLDFVMTYTYYPEKRNWVTSQGFGRVPHVYEANWAEYRKIPAKPLFLGESMYEGFLYDIPIDGPPLSERCGPEIIRRQAYWSVLAGGMGHAYGSWAWMVPEQWRKVKEDTGANQMVHFRRFFADYPWFDLIPDLRDPVILRGGGTQGQEDFIVATRNTHGNLLLVYIPPTPDKSAREFTVDLTRLKPSKRIRIRWFNPVTGNYLDSRISHVPKSGELSLVSPGDNGEGWNDWLLVIDER